MMRPKRTETQEADAVVTEDNVRGDGNKKEREERQSEISKWLNGSSWKKQNHIFVPFLKNCFEG
jgi:hypothetical protein